MLYDLFRKPSLDGAQVILTLDDQAPTQVVIALERPDATITARLSDEDALELSAVLTQAL